MGLLHYVVRRLILMVLVLLGTTVVTFSISKMVPGDPVAVNLGQAALSDPEIARTYRERHGLDKPVAVQYLYYLRGMLRGDMGKSIRTNQPVARDLGRYLPASFELATAATLFSVVAGILFGVLSAVWRRKFSDSIVRAVAIFGVSVPSFWLALVVLYLFYYRLGWAPGPGQIDIGVRAPLHMTGLYTMDSLSQGNWAALVSSLAHLVLPALVLGSFETGIITRTTRSSMLETLKQDYIRTARAKGLSERIVLYRHALANAMIPTVTIIGLTYGNLLGGTVLVETIFAWPGIGRYAYQSVTNLDFPSIMGVTLFITATYAFINLVVDVLYGFLDPRVRYS